MKRLTRLPLEYYDPKMNREEFYEEFGIRYTDWHDHADELFQIADDLGYFKAPTDKYGISSSALSPFNIYFTNQSLKSVGDGTLTIKDIFRKANSYGLRSDEFSKDHDGLHILFAGCSITFGDGMPDDLVWSKIVHDTIASKTKVSGFYNVAVNGANHINIFNQINAYLLDFGMPDVIFINFPDLRRLVDYGIEKEIMSFLPTMYSMLEQLCEASGTKLISFSWDTEINKNPVQQIINNKLFQDNGVEDPRFKFGPTFHIFDNEKRDRFMFEYSQKNKESIYKNFFVRGLDVVHPGLAEQAFYASLALSLYSEDENEQKKYK